MTKYKEYSGKDYYKFVTELNKFLEKNKVDYKSPDFLRLQKNQVNHLVRLERKYKDTLVASETGLQAYNNFVNYIVDEEKNLLVARPYFRERQKIFSKKITPAIKNKEMKKLHKFRINFSLIAFLHKQPGVTEDAALVKLYGEILELRQNIAQTNLPLVLSRSRLFWKKTPRSHLEYMDIVQIAIEGLLTAIDKYVPPFSRVFRSVIIGRVTGSLIADYSQTMLHFFPSDRKTIYRANKARRNSEDIERITNEINEQEPLQGKQHTVGEVKEILSASSHISIFARKDDDDGDSMGHQYEASNDYRPDKQVEELEATTKAMQGFSQLPLFEQKLLRMKFAL